MARILVIDDDDSVRRMVCTMLAREGHEVHGAADGEIGAQMFQESRPDLVITDIIMPEKEGLETIRELHEVASEIPIIAISGGGQIDAASYLELAQQFGASRTFAKPIENTELLCAVEELLAVKQGSGE